MQVGGVQIPLLVEPLRDPVPGARAPDLAQPVLGWRAWMVAETHLGLRLRSVIYDEVWEPGQTLRATCNGEGARHAAPAAPCSCGIHASRSRTEAARYLVGRNDPLTVDRVLGLVALWGVVFEGERGWRAALAYPERLWVPDTQRAGEIARALRVYGAEVVTVAGGMRPAPVKALA